MYMLMRFLIVVGLSGLSVSASAADCSNLNTWLAQQAYTGGDEVQSAGNAFRANWWTQGNDPAANSGPQGSGQPWNQLGSCDGGNGGNNTPIANANGPYVASAGSSVIFSSAGTSDSDGQITGYAWTFGDGASSNAANPSHIYASSGSYNVLLTVTDNDGAVGSVNTSAVISGGPSGGNCAGLPSYMASQSYTAGQRVTNLGNEYNCDIAGWCSSSAAWAYEPGVGAHWGDAWSKIGTCGPAGNNTPIANANGPYTVTIGSSISFSSAGSTDSDGQIVAYSWSFGDGNTSTAANPLHTYASIASYNVVLTMMVPPHRVLLVRL